MPTIRDVAKLAKVAPIIVSRVINNADYVTQETRERVEAAIKELGYVPNMLGQSLRLKQTMTLAVVITDITNPFWTTVTRGIEDVAQANGYSVILCNTDESEDKQEKYLQMLLRRRIDGILFVPAVSDNAEPIRLIQKQNIPVVVLDRHVSGVDVDIVRSDTDDGAYQITKHLLSLGHQHIGILSGPKSVSTSRDRVNGYLRALHENGILEDTDKIIWGEYTQESGYEMAKKALSACPDITAFIAGNNFIAVGVMRFLTEKNMRVPEDIALATIDDLPSTFAINPFFTAATQAASEMGKQATQLLLNQITAATKPPRQEIILPVQMVIRASSGSKIPI